MQFRQHLRLWLCAGMLAAVPACPAQQTAVPPPALTMRQAIELALGKNPDAELARTAIDSAELQRKLARTALLPKLQFDETATRGNDPVYVFGSELKQRNFTQNDFALNSLNRPTPLDNFTTRFTGSWVAFDSWHTQLEIKKARLVTKSAEASSGRSSQEIILRTVRAYESLLLAIRMEDTARHEVKTAQELLDASLTRVEAGLAVEADQLSARAYLAEREQELIAARGAIAVGWAELEAATGAPIPEDQRSLKQLATKEPTPESIASEVSLALKSRQDRASLALQGDAQRVAVRSAEAAFGPQVNTFGDWETDRASVAGSGGNNWTAGVEVRIDLLPAAKRQELAAAKIAANRATATQAAADREITLEVTRAFYEHQAAVEMLAVARASISQTEESLRTLNDRYSAGLATMTDLMRDQDAERRSRTSYEQAVARCATTFAALKFADGTLSQEIAEELQ